MEYCNKEGIKANLIKKLVFFTLDLHIECPPCETVILTGPSGSGKTTALRCLAGLEPMDNGFIRFNGTYWNECNTGIKVACRHRNIGFLSQDYRLFPHMTVRQNIQFATRKQGDADAYLASMGLLHLRQKKPHEISGGERQRAALCQILARSPKLLLLDEPFSALDIKNRHLLRQKLQEVQAQSGLPIIQVTHDIVEALTVSTRIISLHQGHEDHDLLNRQKLLFAKDMKQIQGALSPEVLSS